MSLTKAPAFQFYAQDFLTGTMDMTMEEKGIYITLLSIQWSKGEIPKERLGLLIHREWKEVPDLVKKKFTDLGNTVRNERLYLAKLKMDEFREKQRVNGLKGGRPLKNKTQIKPNDNPNKSSSIEDRSKKIEVRKKKKQMEVELPFASEIFSETWDTFLQMKWDAHKFKYKSEASMKRQLSNLVNLSGNDETIAIQILNQSIAHQWSGIFAIKNNNNYATSSKTNIDIKEVESWVNKP
tara:strand:- start:4135 stop:4848 length:714 start_codon:yes stop_codon:yes gene_type:complete